MAKKAIIIFLLLLGLFWGTRLINLTILPVFCDEAIYIRWSQIMLSVPRLRFLPLSDGKQPLFMWLTMPVLRFFGNPLFAGRFVSVMAGFSSLVGIFILSFVLFKNRRIAVLSSLFYAVTPFFVFFDRMALVDSLLTAFGIWVFLLATILVNNPEFWSAMLTGIFLGGAWLTKSPAIFFAILIPSTVILKNKKLPLQLIKLEVLWAVVYFVGFGMYNFLRLGSEFHMIALRNKDYVFSFKEILNHPLDPLIPHLRDYLDWFPKLFTLPLLLASLLGLVWFDKKRLRPILFLFLIFLFPLLGEAVVAKVFTSRYVLFAGWPLLILAASGTDKLADGLAKFIKKESAICLLVFGLVVPPLVLDLKLIADPQQAPLPREMRSGYLEEWTSGYGLTQVVEFINQRLDLSQKQMIVGTEGFFGTLPQGLEIYLTKNKRVTILGVGQPIREVHSSLLEAVKNPNNEVYLVVNKSRMMIGEDQHLALIASYPKAIGLKGQDFLLLYQVRNDEKSIN